MRIQKRLLLLPAAVLLAGASGIGYVHAAVHTTSPTGISAPVQPDNNTADVQQGDQTAPDVAGATAEANTSEAASAADAPGGADVQQGDQTGADTGN